MIALLLAAAAVIAAVMFAVRIVDRAAQRDAWRRIAAARHQLGEERRQLTAMSNTAPRRS